MNKTKKQQPFKVSLLTSIMDGGYADGEGDILAGVETGILFGKTYKYIYFGTYFGQFGSSEYDSVILVGSNIKIPKHSLKPLVKKELSEILVDNYGEDEDDLDELLEEMTENLKPIK